MNPTWIPIDYSRCRC